MKSRAPDTHRGLADGIHNHVIKTFSGRNLDSVEMGAACGKAADDLERLVLEMNGSRSIGDLYNEQPAGTGMSKYLFGIFIAESSLAGRNLHTDAMPEVVLPLFKVSFKNDELSWVGQEADARRAPRPPMYQHRPKPNSSGAPIFYGRNRR